MSWYRSLEESYVFIHLSPPHFMHTFTRLISNCVCVFIKLKAAVKYMRLHFLTFLYAVLRADKESNKSKQKSLKSLGGVLEGRVREDRQNNLHTFNNKPICLGNLPKGIGRKNCIDSAVFNSYLFHHQSGSCLLSITH